MNYIKFSGLLLVFLISFFIAQAEVRLPALIQSNMVLQQNSELVIWGWAEPGEEIKIKLDWLKDKIKLTTDGSGVWRTTITTATAGGPHEILIKGKGNKIELENILFGEVWLCSGQSNMEYSIKRLGGWDADIFKIDKQDFIDNDYSSIIRLFTVPRKASDFPQDTCSGSWQLATLDNVDDFSAVAFFFGRELVKKLNVPVGLINSSWGGTPAQAWTPVSDIEASEQLSFYHFDPEKEYRPQNKPGNLFNGMIQPLLKYKIRGVIWYQGEANRNDAKYYKDLFSEMIWSWRREFNLGIFPFYYVQIAPYRYNEPMAGAFLREAQIRTLDVPGTGMAVTLDIGDFSDIHPSNKQDVGKRLALQALAKTYGFNDLEYSGPVFTRGRVEEIPYLEEIKGIRLSFDNVESGIILKDIKDNGFIIAGKDQVFHKAEASVEGNSIFIWNEKVINPYAVRYAFSNTPKATLFNGAGLPASSFRTDQFQIITEKVEIIQKERFSERYSDFEMSCSDPNLQIRYTYKGPEPILKSRLYVNPIRIIQSGTIMGRAFQGNVPSLYVARIEYRRHIAIGCDLVQNIAFSEKYPAGGEKALVNGILGSEKFQDGNWQGYEGEDLNLIIDLKRLRKVSKVSFAFLQDFGNWIFLPEKVEVSFSIDGNEYSEVSIIGSDSISWPESSAISKFSFETKGDRVRYVKIKAKNLGEIPSWHPGAGEKAWLFTDEIIIE